MFLKIILIVEKKTYMVKRFLIKYQHPELKNWGVVLPFMVNSAVCGYSGNNISLEGSAISSFTYQTNSNSTLCIGYFKDGLNKLKKHLNNSKCLPEEKPYERNLKYEMIRILPQYPKDQYKYITLKA